MGRNYLSETRVTDYSELCNRSLYATFPYYMTDYPNCPVCKDETETDLRIWHKHRALRTAKRPDVVGAKE
jgi:hypothetical protein